MEIKELMQTFAHAGKVEWLSYRPGPTSRGELKVVKEITVSEKKALKVTVIGEQMENVKLL